MDGGGGRWAVAGAAAAALAAGFAAGWFAGRRSAEAPPPPPAFVNPLADARKGENVVLRRNDGARVQYLVLEADADTVLLAVDEEPPGEPRNRREIRVPRSFFGSFLVLEGDVPADLAAASVRDFRLEIAGPETIFVERLSRSFRCWKFSGTHRSQGAMTSWISDEIPVHGLVRQDTPRGKAFEVESFGFGQGR